MSDKWYNLHLGDCRESMVQEIPDNSIDFIGLPVIAQVLGECENLHKALAGWRKANSFFAKWTPFFEAETWAEGKDIMKTLAASGWKVGTGFAGKDYKLVGPTSGASTTLYNEIKTHAQIISGATGIPIHFLGFADVMSNRSTADSLTEPMEVIALTDMVRWRGFYEQLFDMAIKMRNDNINSELQAGVVKPKLAPVTDRQYERLTKFWLPAAEKGLVSKQLFLEQIPEIDEEEELKRLNQGHLEGLFEEGERELDSMLNEEDPTTPE